MTINLPEDVRLALAEAAVNVGLTGAAEYLRIAAGYLVESQTLPPQFAGRRSVMKTGRPRAKSAAEPYSVQDQEDDARVGAAILATAIVARAQGGVEHHK